MSDWIENGEDGLSIRNKLNSLKSTVDLLTGTTVGTSGTSGTSVNGTSGTSSIGTSGTSGTSSIGTSGTSGTSTDGTSGSSGTSTNGTSGSSGTSTDGTSGTSSIGTSGSSGRDGAGSTITGYTFTQELVFDENKYFTDLIQDSNIIFSSNGGSFLNVIYSKISVDSRYTLSFSPNFIVYRNELDGNGVYDFWFTYLPDQSVVYSIIKTGTYTPAADVLPYSEDIVARYNFDNVTLDGVSGKVTAIVNSYNSAYNLTSSVDLSRPTYDPTNKRLVFNGTALTENLSGTTAVTFVTGTTWCAVFLLEYLSESLVGSKGGLLSSLNVKPIWPYNNIGQLYLNNTLKSSTTNDAYVSGMIGVHKYAINQSTGSTDFYIDDVLIATNAPTGSGLTLSNIFSEYNSTRAIATKLKYVYDGIIYSRSLSTDEMSNISTFFNTKYADFIPNGGPVIANYATSGITAGQNITSGTTINVTYDVVSGSPSKLCIIIKQGSATLKTFVISSNLTSFVIPSGLAVTTNYFTKAYLIDSNGRLGNGVEYSAIKFNIV